MTPYQLPKFMQERIGLQLKQVETSTALELHKIRYRMKTMDQFHEFACAQAAEHFKQIMGCEFTGGMQGLAAMFYDLIFETVMEATDDIIDTNDLTD